VSRRRTVVAAVAAVAVLAMILVLSNPEENRYDRPPLDPRGTGPGGVAALVELLRAEGAQVRIGGTPDERDDVARFVSYVFGPHGGGPVKQES